MIDRRLGKLGIATLACLALGVASCGDSTAPEDAGPILLTIVGGDEQTGVAGQELPEPLVVKATNHRGRALRHYLVNFVVTKGDGTVFAGAAMTNRRGVAQDYWTLGAEPGENVVEVRAVDAKTGTKLVFATFRATGTAVPVHTVAVTPESAELQLIVDPNVQLSVVLKDADGNVLTGRDVEWASDDEDVATVDGDGLVTAVGDGEATITASSGGESDDVVVTVKQAPVYTVLVGPADFELELGGAPSEQQLTVTLLDQNGNELTGREVSYTSSPAGVVEISSDGLVTAVGVDDATITVTSEGVEAEATVTVTAAETYEPNNGFASAWDLGQIEQDEVLTIQADFDVGDASDYYRVRAHAGSGVCNSDGWEDFNFTIDLTNIPAGSNYDLFLFKSDGTGLLPPSQQPLNADEQKVQALAGTCDAADTWDFVILVKRLGSSASADDKYTLSMVLSQPAP